MTTLPASFIACPVRVSAPSQRVLMGLLIALCVFSALLGRFCFLLRPFDNDAAIFIYMGQMVAGGGRLCHDLIDNKFPTVGLMTSIIWKAFGIHWWAYIALQTLLSFVTALLLGRTAARITGPASRWPTMLFALLFLNLTTAVFGGFQLETLQVFFAAIAAGAGIEMLLTASIADGFLAGLAAGCGMMLKPTGVGVLAAIIVVTAVFRIAEFFDSRGRKPRYFADSRHRTGASAPGYQGTKTTLSILSIIAGLLIPSAVTLIYLTQADLLHDMPGLIHQISTYARETVFDMVELIKPVTALALLGFPILIRGVVCRRQRDPQALAPVPSITMFLILWLIIETIGVILQRRMYAYHFLPMVPPAALLFGTLPRYNRAGSLAAALLPVALLSILQAANLMATTRPGEDRLPLSDFIAAHAKPGDAVWMDAWPRIVLETGLRPGARLPFTFLFTNYDNAGLDYSAGMIADFERIKPAYIILPVPLDKRLSYQVDFIPELNRRPIRRENYIAGWHRIEQYTLEHYTREAMVGNDAVYHRRPG